MDMQLLRDERKISTTKYFQQHVQLHVHKRTVIAREPMFQQRMYYTIIHHNTAITAANQKL